MIDMWSGCVDHLEECDYESKVVIDEVKRWRFLDPARMNFGNTSSRETLTHIQRPRDRFQRVNRFPRGT